MLMRTIMTMKTMTTTKPPPIDLTMKLQMRLAALSKRVAAAVVVVSTAWMQACER